jgi:hypothetical protein
VFDSTLGTGSATIRVYAGQRVCAWSGCRGRTLRPRRPAAALKSRWPMQMRARARAEAEAREAVRIELRAEMRIMLEAQAQMLATMLETVRGLRTDVTSRDSDVVRVLELVVNVCDHVVECVEADRDERRLMIDTLGRLAEAITQRASVPEIAAPTSRVIGGNVFADDLAIEDLEINMDEDLEDDVDDDFDDDDDVIDLDAPAPVNGSNASARHDTVVEVRCRFGDRWVDGFEVCESIHAADGERYRLRRRSDGMILPELFAAADVRHVETFEELMPASDQPARGIWSKL